MKITKIKNKGQSLAIVESSEKLIIDVQSALDFFMSIKYETNCDRIALNKNAIIDDFFILSNGLAGEIIQKFVNYRIKFAVYGDFSEYTSKPLKDFMFEANKGNDIFFVASAIAAEEKLAAAI